MSSRSASDWITRSVILNAKAKLATTNLSVQQIADELNFPNPSFFGQYFLRHTGMTPKEYRRSRM
jgi:AraC-like DNA-binding protein